MYYNALSGAAGGGELSFAPPPWVDFSMIMVVDHLLLISRIISSRISNYFLFFNLKKVSHAYFILSKNTCLYVTSHENYSTFII